MLAQPAQAHCYSVWHYPTRQRCGGIAARAPAPDKSYYVDVASPAPDAAVPLPVVDQFTKEESPAEVDQRTPEQIKDDQEHNLAIQNRKVDINKLMIILNAVEGN